MCLIDLEFSLSQHSFPWRFFKKLFFYPLRLWLRIPSSGKPSWASPGITGSWIFRALAKSSSFSPLLCTKGALCLNPSGLLYIFYPSASQPQKPHFSTSPPVQCPAHCEWPATVWMGWMTAQSIYQATYLPPLRWDSHFSLGNYRGATWLQIVAISISWRQPRSMCETRTLCQSQDFFLKIIEFTSSSAWIGCKWNKIDSRWKLNRFQNNYILVTMFSLIGALAQWTSASGTSAGVTGRHICLGQICIFARLPKM